MLDIFVSTVYIRWILISTRVGHAESHVMNHMKSCEVVRSFSISWMFASGFQTRHNNRVVIICNHLVTWLLLNSSIAMLSTYDAPHPTKSLTRWRYFIAKSVIHIASISNELGHRQGYATSISQFHQRCQGDIQALYQGFELEIGREVWWLYHAIVFSWTELN